MSGTFGHSSERSFGVDSEHGRVTFFQRVLPVFAMMLLVSGAVTAWTIRLGYTSLVADLGLLGFLGLLAVQVGVFYGAQAFREHYPANVVFAVTFAAFEGVFIAPIIQTYLSAGMGYLVAQALVITSVVFVGFAAIPLVTGKDFSYLGGALIAAVFGIIALSVLSYFVGFPGWVAVALDVVSIVVFSLFILYDMSKILKGDFGAVAGAISLYIDFVVIFLSLLQLLGMQE
ncbi:Bax inhibitor-1/YccA family protein [Halobacterium zhouii]|uniref:Bax inhibitor-1/YccA family protein n=1 Tax=Halobacterium zhouii TaxID=2902624 RepID=UPI001E425484|nr:Bax inhibitor-1 family protein [Halobacterium zhouii]